MTKDILLGRPTQIGPLHITPLMWEDMSRKLYAAPPLSAAIKFTELDDEEGPRVENIYVENFSNEDLFLPSGWVIGGNLLQTRILDYDEFVSAGAAKVVSVSCVERGRWSGGITPLDGGRAPITVSTAGWQFEHQSKRWKMSSSIRQTRVWSQVSRQESRNGRRETNSLMQVMNEDSSRDETIRTLQEDVERSFEPLYGQNGMLVSIAGEPLLMEFYSNEEVAQRIIRETLRSLSFDVEHENFVEPLESRVTDFIARSGISELHFLSDEDWAVLMAGGSDSIETRASVDSENKFVHVNAINHNHRILIGV
jgi:hypothetical protein